MISDKPDPNIDPAPHLQETVRAVESLPAVLALMQEQIASVIEHLRSSSGSLEAESVDTLRQTMTQLQKVTSATETAANGILDRIDRSLDLVGELDSLDSSGDPEAAQKRAQLKDHLFDAINCVQFQDITSQQIRHASSLLTDMEERFGSLVRALDPAAIHGLSERLVAADGHFDPDATFGDRARRQAEADAVFR
ncbi:MAG: hypothetical protein HYR75_09460 [Gemmatimonadetes bacterium]|nr:hypothetical protein [Gemmatimonadota bacterium]MBI3504495.1 hypothetical protein [Pseudomonadota bacterium]